MAFSQKKPRRSDSEKTAGGKKNRIKHLKRIESVERENLKEAGHILKPCDVCFSMWVRGPPRGGLTGLLGGPQQIEK